MKRMTASYPAKRAQGVQYAAWLASAMLTLMLLAQLFSYENFASVLGLVLSYNDQQLIIVTAAAMAVGELFALPYLLAMKLSPLMRVASATLGGVVAIFWLFTSLTNAHAENSAIFGDTLTFSGGVIAVLWCLILAGAYAYVVIAEKTRSFTTS